MFFRASKQITQRRIKSKREDVLTFIKFSNKKDVLPSVPNVSVLGFASVPESGT